MHEPDMEKLRRFSLVVALITLTYSLAGISLTPNAGISVMGLTFKVSKPSLLPIGLVTASFYAMFRFYYYGFMLKKSPCRVRRELLNSLHCPECFGSRVNNKVGVYFGPTKFSSSISFDDRIKADEYITGFPMVFPKFAMAEPSMKIESSEAATETKEGEYYTETVYDVQVVIPIRCRLAAMIQDIDYSSPIWLNLVSLIIYFFRIGLR